MSKKTVSDEMLAWREHCRRNNKELERYSEEAVNIACDKLYFEMKQREAARKRRSKKGSA